MINAAYSETAFEITVHEKCHGCCSERVFLHVFTCPYSFVYCPASIVSFYCPPVYGFVFLSANFSVTDESFFVCAALKVNSHFKVLGFLKGVT